MRFDSHRNRMGFAVKKGIRRLLPWLLLPALAFVPLGQAAAAPYDFQLKTVYLFKFTDYVEWPSANPSVRLCFLDRNPYPKVVAQAQAAWKGRRQVQVVVVSRQDVTGHCDVLYLPPETRPLGSKLKTFAQSGTLLVGEDPDFLTHGGMIRLVTTAQGVAFDINLKALHAADLRVSSALLRVARHLEE
ncbi:YfiR family protein [Marinobacteraceae bacterium S3BR75-40.1]